MRVEFTSFLCFIHPQTVQKHQQQNLKCINKTKYKRKGDNTKRVVSKKKIERSTWLAQLVELVTLDLGVLGLSPTMGIEITLKSLEKSEKFSEKKTLTQLNGGSSYLIYQKQSKKCLSGKGRSISYSESEMKEGCRVVEPRESHSHCSWCESYLRDYEVKSETWYKNLCKYRAKVVMWHRKILSVHFFYQRWSVSFSAIWPYAFIYTLYIHFKFCYW